MNDIIDYVTNTPANSNPNVLRDMLKTSGGGNENISEFFSKGKATATIGPNTYENQAMYETCGAFSCDFSLDTFPTWFKWEPEQTITITVDNDSFEIPITTDSNTIEYGATPLQDGSGFDFSEYDYHFNFFYDSQEFKVLSCFVASKEIKESYSLTLEVSGEAITFSNEFQAAIEDVIINNDSYDGIKFIPIYLQSASSSSIDLTEDEQQQIWDGIYSVANGNIPYLDVTFTGGTVPSHSLFFYGHKETNPYAYTFTGGMRIALFTGGHEIIFAPIEQPKVNYTKSDSNIYWRRSGADVFATQETERSNFTSDRITIPAYFKPGNQTYNIYVPIFNTTQNKIAGYIDVSTDYFYFSWFDDGAASTDRIAFSVSYRTNDSWRYPEN